MTWEAWLTYTTVVLNNTPVVAMFLSYQPDRERDADRSNRHLIEVVVSDRCPLIGSTIREGQFRSTYNAAVVAVGRGSQKIDGKIGDVILQPEDTLLVEADKDFVPRQRNSNQFYLISGVENSYPVRHDRAWLAIAVLLGMVVTVALF
jgi:di/tricarboxylate transporter